MSETNRYYLSFTITALLLLTFSGCSKPKFYPVRGDVIVFGVGPLKEGEVQFRPVKRPDLVASGKIQKVGNAYKFSLSTPNHGEGVLEGDCHVAIIVQPKDGKRAIAERYSDFTKSDMLYTVAARDENYFTFDVKKN
jgi:hypothetical protein